MIRSIGFLATFLLLGSPLGASEMDAEFGPPTARRETTASVSNAPTASSTALAALDRSDAIKGSELDAEGPVPSWRHYGGWGFGRGFGGWGYGRGFGGWGFGRGFGGWGYGRGFGYRGYGLGLGFGGWGYGLGLGYGGWGYGLGYGGYGLGGLGYGGFGGYGYGGYGLGGFGYGGYMPVAYSVPFMGYGYGMGCW